MDTRTGDLYRNVERARRAGVPEEHLVRVSGPTRAVFRLSWKVAKANGMTFAEWRRRRRALLSNGARKRWIEPPQEGTL